jgi:hypothetical protein
MGSVATPVDLLVSSAHLARPLQLLAVGGAGGAVYLMALRTGFSQSWSDFVTLVRRLMPAGRGLQRRVQALRFAGAK